MTLRILQLAPATLLAIALFGCSSADDPLRLPDGGTFGIDGAADVALDRGAGDAPDVGVDAGEDAAAEAAVDASEDVAAEAAGDAGEDAAAEAAGDAGADVSADVAIDDASVEAAVDAGADVAADAVADAPVDAGCAIDAAVLALGAGVGGTVIATDFTCDTGIDRAATTATLDLAGDGFARAPQGRTLGDPGSGADGARSLGAADVPEGGAEASVAAGTFSYTSFAVDGVIGHAAGDLVLHVAGPFTVGNGAELLVDGSVTIVASGPVRICGALRAAGDVRIEQPSSAGVVVGCDGGYGEIASAAVIDAVGPLTSGDLEIDTRGAIAVGDGSIYVAGFGPNLPARAGSLALRAYGDITLGTDGADGGVVAGAFVYVNSSCRSPLAYADCQQGTMGTLRLLSEGTVRLDQRTSAYTSSGGSAGGDAELRGGAGVSLLSSSNVYAGRNGSVTLASEGPVQLAHSAFVYPGNAAGSGVTLSGSTVSLIDRSFAYTRGPSADLAIRSPGDVIIDQSSFAYTSGVSCVQPGTFRIDAEGSIAIVGGSYVYAGDSYTDGTCSPGAGGNVVLHAGGTIDAPALDAGRPSVAAGAGSPAGAIDQQVGVASHLPPLDVGLEPSLAVVSEPGAVASTLSFAALGDVAPASGVGVHLVVTPAPGGDPRPAAKLVGAALASGWTWSLRVAPRMFDPASVDAVILRVP